MAKALAPRPSPEGGDSVVLKLPFGVLGRYAVVGALFGIVVLHPLANAVDWFEVHGTGPVHAIGFWSYASQRVLAAFTRAMLPMTTVFALIGSACGLAAAWYGVKASDQHHLPAGFGSDVGFDLPAALRAGESEYLEFKASARWDLALQRASRELEDAVVKTVAAFFNHRGGVLLVGVADSGEILGLAHDYATLKRQSRDGFEQFIVRLIKTRLGGDLCPLVHIRIMNAGGLDVCQIFVEPAPRPVYVAVDGTARLYVRAGNTTREFDAREALEYAPQRWPH